MEVIGVGELLWKLMEVYELVELAGSLQGYMEALRSFHRLWSWKLHLMEVAEDPTSTNSANVHLLPPTSMEASIYFHRSFHGSWWKFSCKQISLVEQCGWLSPEILLIVLRTHANPSSTTLLQLRTTA